MTSFQPSLDLTVYQNILNLQSSTLSLSSLSYIEKNLRKEDSEWIYYYVFIIIFQYEMFNILKSYNNLGKEKNFFQSYPSITWCFISIVWGLTFVTSRRWFIGMIQDCLQLLSTVFTVETLENITMSRWQVRAGDLSWCYSTEKGNK